MSYILFCTLGFVKKPIAILCLVALFLSTSSLAYFHWLQEQLHESKVFSQIEAGTFHAENSEVNNNHSIISFVVKDKSILPEGYAWEEQGREFSYKGMFYDIVSIQKTKDGWMIKAASDEEEAVMVANKNEADIEGGSMDKKKANNTFKINVSKIVYHYIETAYSFSSRRVLTPMNSIYLSSPSQVYLNKTSPPPKLVYS